MSRRAGVAPPSLQWRPPYDRFFYRSWDDMPGPPLRRKAWAWLYVRVSRRTNTPDSTHLFNEVWR